MSTILDFFLFPPKRLSLPALRRKTAYHSILITGASYGIGAATAQLLAAPHVHLILVARSADRLQLLQKELVQQGATVQCLPTDLTCPEQVERLLQTLTNLPKGLDVVISNAGHSILRSIHPAKTRLHDFERTIDLNYLAPVRLLLPLLDGLEARGGQIINVSAVNVLLLPAPYWSAYQASKTAFDQWFRAVAPEMRARGVQCSSAYLPLVRTRMIAPTKAYQKAPAMSAEQAARVLGQLLLHRHHQFQPWWAAWAILGSALFRRPWEWACTQWIKRRERHNPS